MRYQLTIRNRATKQCAKRIAQYSSLKRAADSWESYVQPMLAKSNWQIEVELIDTRKNELVHRGYGDIID